MIPPALTKEEWRKRGFDGACIAADWVNHSVEIFDIDVGTKVSLNGPPRVAADAPRLIAALNAILPDTDPRKITWAMVDALRLGARCYAGESPEPEPEAEPEYVAMIGLADALASYLPPVTSSTT